MDKSLTTSFYALECVQASGDLFQFKQLEDKVVLIVNTASECGFTRQYKQLQALYTKYQHLGFTILAFPCNQFGKQEPSSNEQVIEFCQTRFQVNFPIMSKSDVNGKQANPVFKFLKKQQPGLLGSEFIKWNFTKFLVDLHGNVVKRFSPKIPPIDIAQTIETLL
ncbi:glutathione peroxidase [Saccharobesus litoralis]|uniref:Glutathione peroxidase n=1 Tax=Saccharobesus litoralis TaxID=2172099 RepID=A0A2S0VU21_9ALTE|nr:glutathione peroxidase [Saccharobesus litoralis]AWB67708.1 glutathione peroxidase [Saccharobesus litoralis]